MLPSKIAPNLVTFLGFIGVLVAFATMFFYNPDLDGGNVTPQWAFYLSAFLLFYYQTMDAIDGKHARNTKSSSALGELFDHGLDAVTTMFQTIIIMASLQLGPGYWSCLTMFLMYITSYLVIWEDYVTDELRFGALNSPTEAILLAVSILVATGMIGSQFWLTNIFGTSLNKWVISASTLLAASVVYDTIKNVLTKARGGSNNRANSIGGMAGALRGLWPIFGVVALYVIYSIAAPELVHNHIVSFVCSYGLLGSYMQTRMILARVCHETIPIVQTILVPLPFVVLNAVFIKYNVVFVHSLYLIYILACYSHLVYNVITEITLVLGIECFSQKKHPRVENGFAEVKTKSQ